MLPTIHMPEPMQETVPAFGTSGLAATCSATECCCWTILSVTSAAFADAFLAFSGALLLKNMSTSVLAGMQCRKGQRLSCRDQPQAEGFQVRMPFENRTAQTRTATAMEPTIASHSVYGAVSGISFPDDSRRMQPVEQGVRRLVRDDVVRDHAE